MLLYCFIGSFAIKWAKYLEQVNILWFLNIMFEMYERWITNYQNTKGGIFSGVLSLLNEKKGNDDSRVQDVIDKADVGGMLLRPLCQ